MDLWIRSQDKTQLAQITGLLLNYNEIRGFTNYHQNYYELGTYKTKERALEVLDEIQNSLLNKWANNVLYEEHYDDEQPRSLVYEMPQE